MSLKDIPLDDEKTWNLIGSGRTKGLFQIESQLGQDWCRRIKPRSIEELSAVIALVRPGPLQSGQSDLYAKRKHGDEPVTYLVPELESILGPTQGINLYQEQSIRIVQEIAGFNEVEADLLRKSIGKKLPEEMAKIKIEFMEKAEKKGIVTKEQAEEIFKSIETAQRYSFNKSITKDTLVELEDGLTVSIENLVVGSKVKCPTNDGKSYEYRVVKNKYNHGVQPVHEVKLDNGYTIKCTVEHKFLCSDLIVRRMSTIFLLDLPILCNDGKSYKISWVDQLPETETFDIEIDNDHHCFFGNGVATSNSHSISYALLSYQTAYMKAHYPVEFYCAWLNHSEDKINPKEEIYELSMDAKMKGIEIDPPDIRKGNDRFIIENRRIKFGLSYIRGVGGSTITAINKLKDDLGTFDRLLIYSKKIKRNVLEAMIKAGACDSYGLERSEMLQKLYIILGRNDDEEEDAYKKLSKKELDFVLENLPNYSLQQCLEMILAEGICVKNRILIIKAKLNEVNKKTSTTNKQKAIWEKIYLGLPVTCSVVDDTVSADDSAISCKEVFDTLPGARVVTHVVIDKVRKAKTKKGKQYVYLGISDNSGALDNVVCWPNIYEKIKNVLKENSVVTIYGRKDAWRGREQIVIDNAILV